jgi:hypothetical protein
MSPTARFSIQVDPLGYSKVTVNDEDVTERVQSFRVESAIGSPSVLSLFSSAKGEIQGEGIVYVEPHGSEDLARFVEQLDPEQVEKAAIERDALDPTKSLTHHMLDVVADAARGKA